MASKVYFSPFIPTFNGNGLPVANARLYFFDTGTEDLAPIYEDSGLTIPMDNPVISDGAARYPNIYLDEDIIYRVRETGADGTPLAADIDPYIPGMAAVIVPDLPELAAPTGAALIGTDDGDTVQEALDEINATASLTSRAVPHANFNWFTTLGWSVTGVGGRGLASLNKGLTDIFNANYGALIGVGTAWVAPDGNDTTGAGTLSAPYLTLQKALSTTAYNILVMPGVYGLPEYRYNTDTASNKIKRVIAPFGGVTLRVIGDDISAATWTANGTFGNVWETTLAGTTVPLRILMTNRLDKYGEPVPLSMSALEDEVAATALAAVNNSGFGWWFDIATRKLYVRHRADNVETTVKANLRAVYGNSGRDNRILLYATNSYWENLTIEGYFQLLELAANPIPQIWAKDVTLKYCRSDGILNTGGYYYADNVRVHRGTTDGFKINNGIIRAHGVEINCITQRMGDPETYDSFVARTDYPPIPQQTFNPIAPAALNKNGSSNHTGDVIRVNGFYTESAGPNIGDTAGSYGWNLGVWAPESSAYLASGVSIGMVFQGAGQNSWNDHCEADSAGSGYDSSATATVRMFMSYGSRTGAFVEYVPVAP